MNGFVKAVFLRAAGSPGELPPEGPPEIAFAGRSNVGKSSAINALLGQRGLARTSKTPGRTQTINFYEAGEAARFVDLPGYGFARVPLELRARWRALVGRYFESRTTLRAVVLIMDARHPLTPLDLQLAEWLRALPLVVLLAKADKLSRGEQARTLRAVRAQMPAASVGLFSSVTRQGVDEARDLLQRSLQAGRPNKKPPVKGI
ncbi:MAG TPA: ribosome biogenesis GTP-binding protein YihA/YsxC [Burkholderiales bacterium]|nr:ribosome biogenesis GTP-binding protein YihA/YsxC [Burkholderiales bacterium]